MIYSGYKASFSQGITEIGCMAHARRKFHDLHVANQSPIAEKALRTIALLYDVEREAAKLDHQARQQLEAGHGLSSPFSTSSGYG